MFQLKQGVVTILLLSYLIGVSQTQNGSLKKGIRKRKLLPSENISGLDGSLDQRGQTKQKRKRPNPDQSDRHQISSLFDDAGNPNWNHPVDVEIENKINVAQNIDGNGIESTDNRRMKVRRKKVQNQNSELPVKKFLKRKNPALKDSWFLTTTSTTQKPNHFDENALNRTFEDQRFLSLFTIVSFKNDVCSSGSGTNGTCYSSSDCSRLGGTASGSCASGFGVCCQFTKTCGQTTSNNCTYFQNTGYPSTFNSVGSCQLTINKCSDSVCQLRLDFDNFVLSQPESVDNVCTTDQLIISGGSPIPAICGTNSGQHVYVDMGLASNNPIVLTVVTSGASFARSFSIKVCQIECTSLSKASDGCLQYFTGVTGQIQSFNYNSASALMLSNTDYTVCMRMERNFCGIQYTTCPDSSNTPSMAFSLTGGTIAQGSMVGTNCATDWITIPCATNTMNPAAQTGTPSVCVDRICGMVFNSVTTAAITSSVSVNSYSKPFVIHVHTNSVEGTQAIVDTRNRGFCLNFVQQPCTNSG